MPTYYAELTGGTIKARDTFSGGTIYSGGGGGGATLQTKFVSYTPTASEQTDTVTPDAGYDGLSSVDVTVDPMPTASAPTIDTSRVDSTGKVTVDIEINNGGYIGAGTYEATDSVPLPTQAAQTIYPSASDQSIASGKWLTGAQTIKGVTYSGLDASNIKKDVVVQVGDSADPDRIVSVTGTYEGGGGGGGNAYSGTITPASDTETLTIDVPALCSFATVFFNGTFANFTPATSGRTTMFVFGNATDYFVEDCNTSKGGIARADRQPSWRGDGFVFSATQITVKCLGNGVITKFPAGQTYRWFAS